VAFVTALVAMPGRRDRDLDDEMYDDDHDDFSDDDLADDELVDKELGGSIDSDA
jgi:hypothetical protein